MTALDERQRKFVLFWIARKGRDAAAAAREAGYSDHKEAAKVAAHRLLKSARIQAALREESARDMGVLRMIAVLGMRDLLLSKNPSVKQKAIDSVLDRTGLPRRTEQAVEVEDRRGGRSYEQLLEAVAEKLKQHKMLELPAPEVKDAEFVEVDGEAADDVQAD